MIRFFLFNIPVLMNCATGGILFMVAYRFSEAGVHKMMITGSMAIWAFMYSIVCLILGRLSRPSRAYKILLGSAVMLVLVSLAFLWIPSLKMQYLWVAIFGAVFASFTTPFQVYMKSLEKDKVAGVARSTCIYTISFSAGLAIGALAFSSMGPQCGYILTAVMGLVILAELVYLEKHKPDDIMQEDEPESIKRACKSFHLPDCALLGWIMGGCGMFTIAIARSLEPDLALQMNVSRFHTGLILSTMSAMQVLVAFVLLKRTRWYYSKAAVAFMGFCGIAGLVLYALQLNCIALYIASFFYGTYSGMFYLMSIYHSLVHPYKSMKYVAVNEGIAGVACVLGPFIGGYLAEDYNYLVVFGFCAVIVVLSTISGLIVLQRQVLTNT